MTYDSGRPDYPSGPSEYDFTDYPRDRECICCTQTQNEAEVPGPQPCEGECGEWLCGPCIEREGPVCAACREEAAS